MSEDRIILLLTDFDDGVKEISCFSKYKLDLSRSFQHVPYMWINSPTIVYPFYNCGV